MAKDKWNRGLEDSLRKVYETDWRSVREMAEDRVSGLVQKVREGK